MRKNSRQRSRRGISTTELVLVIGGLLLVIVAVVSTLGQRVSSDLGTTAGDVANPAELKNRFSGPDAPLPDAQEVPN